MKPIALTFLTALIVAGCSTPPEDVPVTNNVTAAPTVAQDWPTTTYEYPSDGGRTLKMDVYAPKAGTSLHRAVILIHGGGWIGGSRTQMLDIGKTLAAEGLTPISIDYTLANVKLWPAQLEDAQAAVRFVRSKAKDFDIDPKAIAAAGVSAGGHLSLFLGSVDAPKDGVSSRVQAVCSISGIHDLNQPLTTVGDTYHIIEQLLGEKGKPDHDARRKASPIEAASKSTAPVLFVQGTVDPLVPQAQSDKAAERLKALGVEAKVVLVEGMGHGIQPTTDPQRKALQDIANWLKSHLTGR
jgi:acetyl esterase/lipase